MQRSGPLLHRSLHYSRRFCTSSSTESNSSDKIVAAVLFERLPIVVPKIHPTLYAFQQFSFRWGKMSVPKKKDQQKQQPNSAPEKLDLLPKGDYELEYKRVPWTGNADKDNNRRSPLRVLDRRLYLLLYGCPPGIRSKKPVWHFPEKVYESEKTLRECAESALKAVIGDVSHARFVANAPMAHMAVHNKEVMSNTQSFKRFFFKSQVVGNNKFQVENCEDFVWVTKDEMLEYFPEQADFLKKMIISNASYQDFFF